MTPPPPPPHTCICIMMVYICAPPPFLLQWWPKITRKLEPVLNIELWESHIKQVEGHFGTAVASYFVLLRWLFYMNLTILVVWMLFVLIPQFVVEPSLAVEKAYLLNPCISPNISYQCPGKPKNSTIMVYRAMKNCTARTKGFTEARSCVRNQSDMTLVTTVPLNVNNKSCPHYPSPYRFCTIQQPSYDLISLVTGRDGYNDTWLFLGHYVNMTVPYNRPVAYLVCTAVVYGISFFMLVVKYVFGLWCVWCGEGEGHMSACRGHYVFILGYKTVYMSCDYSLVVLTAYRMTPIGHMTLV